MKVLLTCVATLCLWSVATCYRPPKMTLTVRNPKTVTVTDHVYFDIKAFNYFRSGEHLTGRFVVAVFGELFPMTALNFVSLAKGYQKGRDFYHYNNTKVHRIIPDFIIQMGDTENLNGEGGKSIYGANFHDESYKISHASSGIVSMANVGKDENASQFFVTLRTARYLDGNYVAFGKVISGMDFVTKLGNIASYKTGKPMYECVVVGCGTLPSVQRYDITKEQLEQDSEQLKEEDFFVDEDEH